MNRIKSILFSCLSVALLLLASCGNDSSSFVAGTYASYESGDYSISKDTLLIVRYGSAGDYKLIRKSSYQTVRDGKLQPTESKIKEYFGHFDEQSKTLVIENLGRKVSFFPDKNSLVMMQREYHKVTVK